MLKEVDYFAYCLLTGADPVPGGEHGAVDIRAIEGVYEAAESGDRIEL
ncbi:hypothetical protein [Halalkalicoccus subterraneus]|nr:hypothetical protein [Halalkalicoccus subterraneus]